MEQLNGYIAINGAGKKIEIYAETLYQAKVRLSRNSSPVGLNKSA